MRAILVVFGLVAVEGASGPTGDAGSRAKRNVLFPSGSGMGIYLALALPLDLPQYEISMSFNYEANYILPTNATELALGPQYTEIRKARDITRGKVYTYIEDHMKKEGLLGRPCLLRTICETQASPVFGHNGLIGDLIHILFTPSSTSPEDISDDYKKAEEEGLKGKENCERMYGNCPIDLHKKSYALEKAFSDQTGIYFSFPTGQEDFAVWPDRKIPRKTTKGYYFDAYNRKLGTGTGECFDNTSS